jgi:hypothetical protein
MNGIRETRMRHRSVNGILVKTTMSSSLPPEILDLIFDHLRDEPTTLKTCCIVSKSWIHRTRKHLFARVASKFHIKLWKKVFPDPSNSPALTHAVSPFMVFSVITTVDGGVGDWIHTFHNLVHLHLGRLGSEDH